MKKIFTLFAAGLMMTAANAETLTVCQHADENSRDANFPVYGLYTDTEGTTSQMIYPAEMLANMENGQISQIKFFATDIIRYGCTLKLSLKEVDETAFPSATKYENATAVATLQLEKNVNSEMTFTLDEPYTYNGGNLMIETKVIAAGNYATTYYFGAKTGQNTSLLSYNSWGSEKNELYDFLPEAEFTYVLDPSTAIDQISADKSVASVRYYNMAGQQIANPQGIAIQVTTYTDGTTSSAKVVK